MVTRHNSSTIDTSTNFEDHQESFTDGGDNSPRGPKLSPKKKALALEEKLFARLIECEQNYFIVRLVIKIAKCLPPFTIFLVLCFCYYVMTYLFCYLELYQMSEQTFLAVFCFIVFNAIFIITNVSFYKAIFTDPGYVTDDFYAKLREQEYNISIIQEEEMISPISEYHSCKQCNKPKPPRSHHCKHCRKCVRKMDHHCPVINNCVGWGNYKYFILLLFWADIMCFYGVFCGFVKFIVVGILVVSIFIFFYGK